MGHVSLAEDKDKWWSLYEHGNEPMGSIQWGKFLVSRRTGVHEVGQVYKPFRTLKYITVMSNMFLILITSITLYVPTIIWNTTDMTACKNLSLFWCTHKKKKCRNQNSSTMDTFPNLFLA